MHVCCDKNSVVSVLYGAPVGPSPMAKAKISIFNEAMVLKF